MKKYKAGRKLLLEDFTDYPNDVFYNTQLQKAMHYEAIVSLPMRIVLKWIDEGILREAVLKTTEELILDRKWINARNRAIRKGIKAHKFLEKVINDVDFEDEQTTVS